jgi:hypothetical protein
MFFWVLAPWRWRQYVSPKRWHLATSLHGAKTQKNIIKLRLKCLLIFWKVCTKITVIDTKGFSFLTFLKTRGRKQGNFFLRKDSVQQCYRSQKWPPHRSGMWVIFYSCNHFTCLYFCNSCSLGTKNFGDSGYIYIYIMLVALEIRHFNAKHHGGLLYASESFHCETVLQKWRFCGLMRYKLLLLLLLLRKHGKIY